MSLVEASLHFPTVVFTIGLGIALVYWLFVVLGAIDLDLFHTVHTDADFDIAAAGKGVGDALAGGAKVPITISASVAFLVCWVLSLLAMSYAPDTVGGGAWVALAVLLATLIVGLPLAGLLIRPLGGVFEVHEGKSNRDYVGHTCTVTTGHVDDGFGQATVEDGGTVLVIPVRCDRPDALARNDKALIIDFDPARQAYLVEPAAEVLPAARDPGPARSV